MKLRGASRTCGVEKKGGVPAHGAASASASKRISSPYGEPIPRTALPVLFLSGDTGVYRMKLLL
jgi:hypothetical protein